jgi:hypothetical protein
MQLPCDILMMQCYSDRPEMFNAPPLFSVETSLKDTCRKDRTGCILRKENWPRTGYLTFEALKYKCAAETAYHYFFILPEV